MLKKKKKKKKKKKRRDVVARFDSYCQNWCDSDALALDALTSEY